MNARDARVLFEQYQRLLRQDRSARAGHTYGDNLFLRVSHVFCADTISLAAAFRQVKLSQSSSSDSVKRHLPIEYAADLTPIVAAKEVWASWNSRGMAETA